MDQYICKDCNLAFKVKKCLTAHMKTQKHINRITNKEIKENKYKCPCGKAYKYKQGLYTHRKSCNHDNCEETKNESDDDLISLKTEVKELKKEIKELKAGKSVANNTTTTTTTNNNHTNIETQNNITIHLNAHGNENLDYLSKGDVIDSIHHVFKSIPNLVAKIYFNPDHPENHNVKITDRRSPYISVYTKDNKWKFANKRDTVGNMIDNSFLMLDDTFEDNKSRLPVSIRNGFERLQKAYEDSEKKTMNNINKEVDMVIMNGPS